MKYTILLAVFSLTFSVLYYKYSFFSVLQLSDMHTCPVCYGENLCKEFKENKIVLQYSSVTDYIFNIISVKNVFFATFEEKKVVLKKLAHNSELEKLDQLVVNNSYNEIISFLVSDRDIKHFKVCDKDSAKLFLNKLIHLNIHHVQTILNINAEPLLLEVFSSYAGWPFPRLYGYCGRSVVMENAGDSLCHVENFNWFDRAYLAHQLLQAAKNLTENHKDFRLYLTDISPDNIAVSENLNITFVDLENAILKKKMLNGSVHHTQHFSEDAYSYSEKEICDNSLSDHNIYAICRASILLMFLVAQDLRKINPLQI